MLVPLVTLPLEPVTVKVPPVGEALKVKAFEATAPNEAVTEAGPVPMVKVVEAALVFTMLAPVPEFNIQPVNLWA